MALSLIASAMWAQTPKRSPRRPVGDGGPAINASINGPGAIAIDGAKMAYVIEDFGDFIRRVDLINGRISTIKPKVKLEAMDSILVDASGDLIVTEFTVNRVRKIHPQDGSVSLVAGSGRMKFSGDGGPAQAAGLSSPKGTTLDSDGNLFIVDMGNNRIRRVDAKTGLISTVAVARNDTPVVTAVRLCSPDSNIQAALRLTPRAIYTYRRVLTATESGESMRRPAL